MEYIKNPMEIENKSFEMIQEIIEETRPDYVFKNKVEESIMKRAIHTTADFDYLDNLKLSVDFIDEMISALKNKATIYTDTNMALSGISKPALKKLGCEVKCFVADERTREIAKEKSITRSMAAIYRAAEEEGEKIFVIGNAPTALFQIIELVNEKKLEAKAVVGVPVGFVGAVESKDAIHNTSIPNIAALGRKGGSNLAAAIVNAILYSMVERD